METRTDAAGLLTPELWEALRRRARRNAWRYELDEDEAESTAGMVVVEALRDFDPGRSSFATRCFALLPQRLIDAARVHVPHLNRYEWNRARVRQFGVTVWEDGRREMSTAEELVVADEGPVGWELEYEDWVRGLARSREKSGQVLETLYLDAAHATMRPAGRKLGISEARVCQIHKEAVGAIRREIQGRGGETCWS